jgi:hypothetical protein
LAEAVVGRLPAQHLFLLLAALEVAVLGQEDHLLVLVGQVQLVKVLLVGETLVLVIYKLAVAVGVQAAMVTTPIPLEA